MSNHSLAQMKGLLITTKGRTAEYISAKAFHDWIHKRRDFDPCFGATHRHNWLVVMENLVFSMDTFWVVEASTSATLYPPTADKHAMLIN